MYLLYVVFVNITAGIIIKSGLRCIVLEIHEKISVCPLPKGHVNDG